MYRKEKDERRELESFHLSIGVGLGVLPSLVHKRIVTATQLEALERNDGVGPAHGPVHTGLLHPGSNSVFES